MCRYVFMNDEKYKNTNSQTNSSIKYISKTRGEVWCKIKILQLDNDKYVFKVYAKIFNR